MNIFILGSSWGKRSNNTEIEAIAESALEAASAITRLRDDRSLSGYYTWSRVRTGLKTAKELLTLIKESVTHPGTGPEEFASITNKIREDMPYETHTKFEVRINEMLREVNLSLQRREWRDGLENVLRVLRSVRDVTSKSSPILDSVEGGPALAYR